MFISEHSLCLDANIVLQRAQVEMETFEELELCSFSPIVRWHDVLSVICILKEFNYLK